MNWYFKCFRQYVDFNSRARRKEYWMFVLINFIISVIITLIDVFCGTLIIAWIYSLVVLIPSLAVCVRRLHDIGKSGWMIFIVLIPIIGGIWLIVLYCKDSQPGDNKWGPNPKGL